MHKTIQSISLAVASILFAAGVEAKTLKIATLAPAGTTWMQEMKQGAEHISQRTEGRVRIKFYPGGVMGNDRTVHRKIRIGQLHGGAFTPGGLAEIEPSIQALGLPLLFKTFAEVDYVRERMDPIIMAAMEAKGFVVLGISEGGFVRILSKQPMQDLETIRRSKVWIPEGDAIGQVLFEALGINPIALPISDVFTGLQTGLIETVTVSPTGAIALQWHSSTAYMTSVPLSYVIGVLAVDAESFGKLSPADQLVVRDEMGRAFRRMDKLNRDDNAAALEALIEQGIGFVEPEPGELERWQSISDRAVETMIANGLISAEIVATLKDYLQSFRDQQ